MLLLDECKQAIEALIKGPYALHSLEYPLPFLVNLSENPDQPGGQLLILMFDHYHPRLAVREFDCGAGGRFLYEPAQRRFIAGRSQVAKQERNEHLLEVVIGTGKCHLKRYDEALVREISGLEELRGERRQVCEERVVAGRLYFAPEELHQPHRKVDVQIQYPVQEANLIFPVDIFEVPKKVVEGPEAFKMKLKLVGGAIGPLLPALALPKVLLPALLEILVIRLVVAHAGQISSGDVVSRRIPAGRKKLVPDVLVEILQGCGLRRVKALFQS